MSKPRAIARWTLPVLLSFALHLSGLVVSLVVWPMDVVLPRIRLQEVVGVPVAAEGTPAESATAAEPASPEPVEPVEPEPVEPEPAEPEPVEPEPTEEPPLSEEGALALRQTDQGELQNPLEPVEEPQPEELPEESQESPEEEAEEPSEEAPEVSEEAEEPSEEAEEPSEEAEEPSEEAEEPSEEAEEPSEGPSDPREASEGEAEGEAEPMPSELLSLPEEAGSGEQLERLLVENSRVVIHLRTTDLTQSPNAVAVRRTMRAVAGYDLYLGSNAFDPLTDFEWMLVRSPNLSVKTQTRLIARAAVSRARARAAVGRIPAEGIGVRWRELEGGVELGRPESPRGEWRQVSWAVLGEEARTLYVAGPRRWVEREVSHPEEVGRGSPLEELESVRINGEPSDLTVVVGRLRSVFAPSGGRASMIQGLILTARFREESVVVARLWFETSEEARRFVLEAQRGLGQLSTHPLARVLDLERLIEQIELHQQEGEVTAWAELDQGQVTRLFGLVTAMLQREGMREDAVRIQIDGNRSTP